MSWDPFLIKGLVKNDVCESGEQYTGPTNNAILDQCVDVQSTSGSRAQCTGPTGRSVSHVKPTFGKKKEEEERNVKAQNADTRNSYPNIQ